MAAEPNLAAQQGPSQAGPRRDSSELPPSNHTLLIFFVGQLSVAIPTWLVSATSRWTPYRIALAVRHRLPRKIARGESLHALQLTAREKYLEGAVHVQCEEE